MRPPVLALVLGGMLLGPGPRARAEIAPAAAPIDHLLIVYLENHTFDNLFGLFPGANGIATRGAAVPQVDRDGKPYRWLPQTTIAYPYPPKLDARFPKQLPNRPFPINRYIPLDQIVEMPVHRFYPNILQVDGGRNDKFVSWGDSGALPMGYFDTTKLPLYPYARQFVLADNWFTSAMGGSWLNHMWLVCACTPVFPNAPRKLVAEPVTDASGRIVGLTKDGSVSPDAEKRIVRLIETVKASKLWPRTAIVISWDDYGGFFDHVSPPVVDRWGPSNRVPTLIISPWAKRSYVDSTQYETVSILRFIEWRWGLQPLSSRDAQAANLLPAFDFTRPAAGNRAR